MVALRVPNGQIIVCALIAAALCVGPALGAPTVDLTTEGASGTIHDAIYVQVDPNATGTGLIESFVRIQTNDAVEHGYNTDARPLQYDENNSPQFTRSLPLSYVPIVDIGGTLYREFLLDINENNTSPDKYLSLDEVEIYLESTGDLLGHPGSFTNLIYDMNPGTEDNYVLLDYSLNSGSGSGDMFLYVENDLFTGGDYVYLYSKFGENARNEAGFEEWAVRTAEPLPRIPAPGALLLASLGVGLVRFFRKSPA
jgi:hypothetical protein